jgi:hypothetical protein
MMFGGDVLVSAAGENLANTTAPANIKARFHPSNRPARVW